LICLVFTALLNIILLKLFRKNKYFITQNLFIESLILSFTGVLFCSVINEIIFLLNSFLKIKMLETSQYNMYPRFFVGVLLIVLSSFIILYLYNKNSKIINKNNNCS